MIKEVLISEYKCAFIKDDGTTYAGYWVNGVGSKVIPFNGNHKFIDGNGGLYNILLRKENGDVYVHNNSNNTLNFLQYDNNNTLFRAKSVECYLRTYIAVRDNGQIYAMGYNSFKWFGTNTSLVLDKWTRIPGQPSGVKFKFVTKGGETGIGQLVAITDRGEVYILNDNTTIWIKKLFPTPVEKVYGSVNNFYVALSNGTPYGWGQSRYLTGVKGIINTPEDLTNSWNLKNRIIDIAINDNTIHYITDDNKLWGFGDNAQGEVGVGWELVNRKELYKGTQYIWNWISAIQPTYQEIAFIPKPQHIRSDKLFSRVWAGNYYSYYKYAQELGTNDIYSWGRNKGSVLSNTMAVSNDADYPNSMDILKPTKVDVFGYVIPAPEPFIIGSVSAGQDQKVDTNFITLNGSATPSKSKLFSYSIQKYQWTKLSGPDCLIESPNSPSTRVLKMTIGTYIFELKVTDNNGATMTDTTMITVEVVNKPPTVDVKNDQLVIGNCTTVVGEVLDFDGTIISTNWEKISGPEGDIIMNSLNSTTDIIFTTPGVYIYRLSATDNNGESSYDDITITVLFKRDTEVVTVRECN